MTYYTSRLRPMTWFGRVSSNSCGVASALDSTLMRGPLLYLGILVLSSICADPCRPKQIFQIAAMVDASCVFSARLNDAHRPWWPRAESGAATQADLDGGARQSHGILKKGLDLLAVARGSRYSHARDRSAFALRRTLLGTRSGHPGPSQRRKPIDPIADRDPVARSRIRSHGDCRMWVTSGQ